MDLLQISQESWPFLFMTFRKRNIYVSSILTPVFYLGLICPFTQESSFYFEIRNCIIVLLICKLARWFNCVPEYENCR